MTASILLLALAVAALVLAVYYIGQQRKSWPGYNIDEVVRKEDR